MVNKLRAPSANLDAITGLLRFYLVVVIATLALLGVLAASDPAQAPQEAWTHAVIVAVFAVLLLVRAHAARGGSVGALRAVGLISAVLLLANVIEALFPGFVPMWMRVEMIGIAILMAVVILFVVRERV